MTSFLLGACGLDCDLLATGCRGAIPQLLQWGVFTLENAAVGMLLAFNVVVLCSGYSQPAKLA